MKDHLGNGRVYFSDMNKDGIVEVAQNGNANELLQQEHYYPFGMGIKGEWKFVQPQIGGTNLEQFNDIELNDDFGLNWNMAMFRTYDPSIGRWGQIDPLSQLFLNASSYSGMGNNPIRFSDPLGLAPMGAESQEDGRVPAEKKKENNDWIPSVDMYGHITLTAEEGDNASTLKDFFGSEENGKKYVRGAYFNENMQYSKGDKVQFNSTNKFSQTMDFYHKNKEHFKNVQYSYDCKDLCRHLILRNQPLLQVGTTGSLGTPTERQAWGYTWNERERIELSELEFGSTFSFWYTGYTVGEHAAVFFGRDRSGKEYFFSKNGQGPLVIMDYNALTKVYGSLWWRVNLKSKYAE